MNLHEAIAALRATKLPTPRQRQLVLEASHAPSDAARNYLVLLARQEAQESAERHQDSIRREFRDRYEWSVRNPPREPEPQGRPTPRAPDRPEARPVIVTWTTPRKPDLIRPERHAEMHKGEERSRAQRERVEPAGQLKEYTAKVRGDLSKRTHGKPSTYNSGCRCTSCITGYSEWKRARYAENKKIAAREES